MVIFGITAEGARESRLGVTVTKKVGKAVVRNRCRRRIKELFRLLSGSNDVPCDIVINARRGCATAPWEDLVEQLGEAMILLRRRLRRAPVGQRQRDHVQSGKRNTHKGPSSKSRARG